MRRKQSTLLAPYQTMGVVCSDVRPAFRTCNSKRKMTSIVCATGNVLIHYNATKLRTVAVSDCLPSNISAVAANTSYIFAAAGDHVYLLTFCRNIDRSFNVRAPVKHMTILGEQLIIVDVSNGLRVFDIESGEQVLHLEGSKEFEITSLEHPSTYINKVVVGSSNGSLRLINIRTGKIVHEFTKVVDASIVVIHQTPAVDVLAFGLSNGRVVLHNIRVDETICSFKHDHSISAIGFRTDGEPLMTTADEIGHIAVWDLEKKELLGKITKVHTDVVTQLHFLPGEPIMISTSADNSIRTWVLDGGDGMPRQLNILEGHSQPVSAVKFSSKMEIVSSGFDGSVRKYTVNSNTTRQKLGSAGVMSRAKAKKQHRSIESIRIEPVVEIKLGWSREAAWDNILCRHKDTLLVTTWTSRKNSQGTHKLVHPRFTSDSALFHATATATCLSPCGNFAFIGYSTGHIDQFNVQSGRHIKAFVEAKTVKENESLSKKNQQKAVKAHTAAVTALSIDSRGSELVSGCSSGKLKFWQVRSGACVAVMKTRFQIESSTQSPASSLLAVACKEDGSEGESASVAVVDTLCRRVVRNFKAVGKRVNAISFSADGRWLLTADNEAHIRVWELSTSQLIDVVLFEKPCIGMSFNSSGEFLATVHEDEKAVHIWANKTLFTSHIAIQSLPLDYIPSWDSTSTELGVDSCAIDDSDSDDDDMDATAKDNIQNAELISYSGLPPSRWANLSDLALIKERNKPVEPVKKPKQAPFFLTAAPTLEGFEFDVPTAEDEVEKRKSIQAKRSLLELESSFSAALRNAASQQELILVFDQLKKMSVSAIDFQLKSLPSDVLAQYFRMLLEVLKTRRDFDLVQSYMAAAIKTHRAELWSAEDDNDLSSVLEELSLEEEKVWDQLDDVIVDNAAVVQWVKNALL